MSITVKFNELHNEVQSELKKANKSIYIAVAWITFGLYEELFMELLEKGVKIKLICTDSPPNRKQLELINKLRIAGVDIRLCTMPRTHNHMHHKFAVIDNSTVLNGSFNWSENAKRSFENLTIIKNNNEVSRLFIDEFNKIEALDKKAIGSLQKIVKCSNKHCDGELANLLIFQASPLAKTYEVWGDIISCCSVCGEDSFKVIKQGIADTQLHMFNEKEYQFDLNEEAAFNRDLDSLLTGYSIHETVIHGIGFVCHEFRGREDDKYTAIIWSNKFVGDSVRDRYETDFDVQYE